MKLSKKYLLLLPLVTLTSCGYALNYIVEGNKYNSAVFKENYYQEFDPSLKNAVQGIQMEVTDFIEDINDIAKVDYDFISKKVDRDQYGQDYRMSNLDNSFNYGVQSKLFDGQMVCGGQNNHPERAYQLARVQTDKNGFSIRFSKESSELNYYALQFKATTDNTVKCYKVNSDEYAKNDQEQQHNSTVTITSSFYTKDGDIIKKNDFTSTILFDGKSTNDGTFYKFYAFNFKALDMSLSRVIGFSISYEFDDELINWNKTKGIDIDYSLMLYELFLPGTTWN